MHQKKFTTLSLASILVLSSCGLQFGPTQESIEIPSSPTFSISQMMSKCYDGGSAQHLAKFRFLNDTQAEIILQTALYPLQDIMNTQYQGPIGSSQDLVVEIIDTNGAITPVDNVTKSSLNYVTTFPLNASTAIGKKIKIRMKANTSTINTEYEDLSLTITNYETTHYSSEYTHVVGEMFLSDTSVDICPNMFQPLIALRGMKAQGKTPESFSFKMLYTTGSISPFYKNISATAISPDFPKMDMSYIIEDSLGNIFIKRTY